MKQEEAKTKWCPMSRVAVPVGLTVNRISTALLRISDDKDREYFQSQKDNCNCIASDCMMWLWLSKEEGLGCCGLAKA